MKLVSKLDRGGYHPATALDIPPAGQQFEVDDAAGQELVRAGLAEAADKRRPPQKPKEE